MTFKVSSIATSSFTLMPSWIFFSVIFPSNKRTHIEDVDGIPGRIANWRIAVPRDLNNYACNWTIDDFYSANKEIWLRVHRVILAILNGC